jgi:hypothetical protein
MIKRMLFIILIPLLTGCVYRACPGGGSMQLGNGREGIYGYRGHELHFVIVTDGGVGTGGYHVSDTLFLGGGWTGKIQPATSGQPEIVFKAGNNHIRIGDQKYALEEGRAFVVLTKKGAPNIQQIKITLTDQIKNMVRSDKRFDL